MRHAWYRVEFFLAGRYQGEVRVFAPGRNEAWHAATTTDLYRKLTKHLSPTRTRSRSTLRWLITPISSKEAKDAKDAK